jgi:DNA-binding NarL/FixJ family response regulator
MSKRRILIVDDHPLVREGLRYLIGKQTDLEVCGEAEGVGDALRRLDETLPDLVIVDISLKDGHGIDLIKRIAAHDARAKILVSSMHDELLFAERSLRAGAGGYVSKEEPPDAVIDAMRQVLDGRTHLSARMTERVLKYVGGQELAARSPVDALTDRELQVFEMIGRGLTVKHIARRLELSPATVESHRTKIKSKLSLANAAELSRRATQWVLEKET